MKLQKAVYIISAIAEEGKDLIGFGFSISTVDSTGNIVWGTYLLFFITLLLMLLLMAIYSASAIECSMIKNNKVNAIRFSTLGNICKALACEPGDILKYDPDAKEDLPEEES